MLPEVNKCNTPLEDLNIESYPKEVQEAFWDFFYNVPYIQSLTSPKRLRAKDLPRDNEGKIIIDITKPHILENMDYFRPTALHYIKTGKFTDLRPNPNPNSEFGKWFLEEVRRCREGYVRPSDGEWVTGDLYFYLNYNLISLTEQKDKKSKKALRIVAPPHVWDGHYYKFHYLNQARENGKHCLELASRQKGKTICAASLLARRFYLGESAEVNKRVNCYVTAQDTKFIKNNADQTLDKFQFIIDFLADNTEFPKRRLVSSLQQMQWTSGFIDLDTNTRKGTLNSVTGISAKDDESKLRGTRGVLYILEEAGTFPRLIKLWNNMLPSVQDGDMVYGTLFGYGTAGDNQSDFYAMAEMMYHPDGYDIYGVENVYDLEGKGGKKFSYFFPGYMNYSGMYDKDGNSDVTKALITILQKRYEKKKSTSDFTAVTKLTAEIPVVPQEAIIRTRGNFFPVALINERIAQLELNPDETNDTLVGTLVQNPDGTVKFKPTDDEVIVNFPLKDNNARGALQIFKLPEEVNGKVPADRYVIGHDPVNQDAADSLSLSSTFVIDLYTESIAAEYTGRKDFQDESFELLRLLGIFYNARILYESNNKMCYAYFSKMNCTYMLADTPEYLREKDIVKSTGIGNAHPYTEKILTPKGWTTWDNINIGDYVYGSNGYPTKVIDIPFDDEVDCYKVILRDGRYIECSSGHLFNIITYGRTKKIMSVKQMLDEGIFRVKKHNKNNTIYKESKFYIPVNPCIEYEEKHVDINPYFLGLMIGDGCFVHSKFNKCYFTSAEKDFAVYYSILNYPYKKIDDRHYKVEYPNFGVYAEKYGLKYSKARDKFIPDVYKYNSKQIRLELIQGLFDTDGTTNSMKTRYTTVSRQLGLDVMEVLRSLGINCNIRVSFNEYGPIYDVIAYTSIPLFKLPRKRDNQGGCRSRHAKTGITDIQYIGRKKAKCITVENSDGLYLINDFILTHNSAKGVPATAMLNKHEDELLRDWLLMPKTKIETNNEGEEVEASIPNVMTIKNIALLRELSRYAPEVNTDRVRAIGIAMIMRNQLIVTYGGDLNQQEDEYEASQDDFFKRNGFI